MPLGNVSGLGAKGRSLLSSGYFKRSPKAGPRTHTDVTSGIGASPSSHFERSGRNRQSLRSRLGCCWTSGASWTVYKNDFRNML